MNLSTFGRRWIAFADAVKAGAAYGFALLAGNNTWTGVQTFSAIPVLSGGAISFPATQVPSAGANNLDDYEEGTFTPALSASGSTFSYSTNQGTYTKIGRMVYFDIRIILNTSGNTLTANAVTITGLPFTVAQGAGIFPIRFFASTSSYIQMNLRPGTSTTTGIIEVFFAAGTSNAGGGLANGVCHPTGGTDLAVVGFYYV